jgi:hypothetical protein
MLREVVLAEAYAKHFPGKPPYDTLSPKEQWEIRGYFESRGVLFNPRFGVTGRIGGYSALRDFTLAVNEADRAEEIAKRAGEEEEAEAEAKAAEDEELARATTPRVTTPRKDPERETDAKTKLAELQRDWPRTEDKSAQADATRNRLLDSAMVILEPYAKMSAKQHLSIHFNEEDAEEIAHDALVDWKVKVLQRVEDMRKGKANSKGQLYPDKFVGKKLGTGTARNLIADVGTFVYNKMQSRRKTTGHRAVLAPMDPLASEHEGERGEDEPPIGHQVTSGENPTTEITGAEREQDIYRDFKTLSRDLRRQASTDAADLLDAILKTNSFDDRELAVELSWPRKKLRQVRTVLSSYVKHRAKTIPSLRRLTRLFGEAAERLCEKYAVLNLLLRGSNFLPSRSSKSLASIYEKFDLI